LGSQRFDNAARIGSSGTLTAAARLFRFTHVATFSPTLLRQIAKDIGVPVEDLVTGQPGRQPTAARQPSTSESSITKKPPEPGRG